MTDLIEDYLQEVDKSLRTDPGRKGQIITELQSHLREKVGDVLRENPGADREQVTREVLRDFGNPHDLALAYEPDATVLRKSTGEEVLRIGKAVGRGIGRGTKKLVKGLAIALAALLVLSMGVGVWAYYEVLPIVEKNAPYPVYSFNEHCRTTTCTSEPVSQTFYVHANAREVRMELRVDHASGSVGTVKVTVSDPEGNTKYARSFPASTSRSIHEHTQWSGITGDWTITYEYTAFQGYLDIDVYTIGLPPDVR